LIDENKNGDYPKSKKSKERKKMVKKLIIVIITLILFSCIINPYKNHQVSLDKQHFAEKIIINDYVLNDVVSFSTIKGFQQGNGTYNIVLDDNFLRGFMDKKTKAKTYQVYNVIYYAGSGSGKDWKNFAQSDYQTPEGNKSTPVTLLKKEEDCSSLPHYGKCLYTEHVTFKLDRELMKAIANRYTPDTPTKSVWQYQLISSSGEKYEDKFFAAEVLGLSETMVQYVSSPTAGLRSGRGRQILPSSPLTPELLIKPPPASMVLPLLK
jgi:hypothetical protein